MQLIKDLLQSFRPTPVKQVFFHSLPQNRKIVLWYAGRVVKKDSVIEGKERLAKVDELRKNGSSLTFLCNHLTYADSHIIETLFIRNGFGGLAAHLIHIAGQKTFQIARRALTRSLNTIRVYQPGAGVDKAVRKKMNARALRWAARLKRKGYSLLVFPEGTRTRRHTRFNLHRANPKAILYLRNSIVVPLALMGAERLMPVGSILPRSATIWLRIGEPVDHSWVEKEFAAENPGKSELELRPLIMLHYMNRMNNLLDPDYRCL